MKAKMKTDVAAIYEGLDQAKLSSLTLRFLPFISCLGFLGSSSPLRVWRRGMSTIIAVYYNSFTVSTLTDWLLNWLKVSFNDHDKVELVTKEAESDATVVMYEGGKMWHSKYNPVI